MERGWEADTSALFVRRLGKSASGLGNTDERDGCPDIWELSNRDIVLVGWDVTTSFAGRIPADVKVAKDERVVVIPRSMIIAAKPGTPDA